MRLEQILFLVVLCAMFCIYGWMSIETGKLEQECSRLETEIRLLELEAENIYLHEQYSRILGRMEQWLDEWQVDIWESSTYAPLDPRAKEGMCYAGDPAVTASGAEAVPGVTAAAGPDVPFGAIVRVEGAGWRVVQDRGSGGGVGMVDLAVRSRDEALRWGRKNAKVVWQK